MTEPTPQPRSGRRRRRAALLVGLGLVGLACFAFVLAVTRYLPAIDEARALRSDIEKVATRAIAAGVGVDRPTVDGLKDDVRAGRKRLEALADLLANDPLIAVARSIPPTEADVRGTDVLVASARQLFSAADDGLAIADRFVEIKTAHEASPGESTTLPALVELMATTRDRAIAGQTALRSARRSLAEIPDGSGGVLGSQRDAMTERIDTYAPLLDAYVALSERLPAILGWDRPRRYLLLTQNPAELRPTGGYIGSYGIITFDRGRISQRIFTDVALLDFPWDFPHIQPPPELTDYLLGPGQPWQFADSNWSPDFPTSAQNAVRLYTNESGDDRIDGVIAFTTYTIDELLDLTGPISVPEFQATIAAGETTLKAIQLTRIARPGENRKAFLSTFADHLFASLLALPSSRWAELLQRAETFRGERLLLAWFRDPIDQRFAVEGGFDGAVRQDAGDFLYPVDSNVAPASKINAIATRSLRLDVTIDPSGDARHTLDVTWDNPIETDVGRPYREVPTLESMRDMGMYFRTLAPMGSTIESVSGGRLVPLTAPADVGTEAGRSVFANYLQVAPGLTSLRYVWTSRRPIQSDAYAHRYRLTIQKQPGLLPGPLTVTIRVPAGFHVQSASGPLRVAGDTATLTTTFEADVVLQVSFVSNTPLEP